MLRKEKKEKQLAPRYTQTDRSEKNSTLPHWSLQFVAEHVVVRKSLKLKILFGSHFQLAWSRARLTVH